ncbi:hypothetical protein SBA4_1920005 [Candidatus Sulfopaludibacter sp. SbA4]|nr:hypothetical protein SBA4_1920005 [Candidatus Sulfopaludibacter sp. SbA4]
MYLQTQPNNSIRASRSTRKRKDLPSGCIGANITKDFSIWAMLAHAQGLYLNVPANMLRQTIIGLHLALAVRFVPGLGARTLLYLFSHMTKRRGNRCCCPIVQRRQFMPAPILLPTGISGISES